MGLKELGNLYFFYERFQEGVQVVALERILGISRLVGRKEGGFFIYAVP